jgi:Tfp pilus assembly protein PilN
MYIRLNLATKPLVSHRRFLVGSALFGLVGIVLFVSLGWHFLTLRKADEDFRARVGKIQQEMDRLQEQRKDLEAFYSRPENRNLQERAKFIGGVIEARSFNWTKMFMDLEHTLPPGVHVLRIDPKLEHGSVDVKFVIAGSSEEAKEELLKAFEESRSFTHIELTSEGSPKQGGAENTDVFALEFSAIYTGI